MAKARKFGVKLKTSAQPPGPLPPVQTARIVETLTGPGGGRTRWTDAIANGTPLRLPEADLPTDPYTFGAWLAAGEGSSGIVRMVRMIRGTVPRRMKAEGHAPGRAIDDGPGAGGRVRREVAGLAEALAALRGAPGGAVPYIYLRASEAQRRALFEGFMEASGRSGERGRDAPRGVCEVRARTAGAAEALRELLRTLGFAPAGPGADPRTVRFDRAEGGGAGAEKTSRGAAGAKRAGQRRRAGRRAVVGAEPAGPMEVNSVIVDTASGLYLVGRGFTATLHGRPREASAPA